MTVAGVAAGLVALWLISMAAMGVSHVLSVKDRLSLLDREAKVAGAESRVSAYRGDLDKVVGDLQRRQAFIEKVTEAHLGDLPSDVRSGETVSQSSGAAAETVRKVSAALPEAGSLAQLEARQLAYVENLTRLADRRSAAAESRLTRLGLNPGTILARLNDREAMGGPLMAMMTSADGTLDPRFERLGASLARMDALERGLQALPQVLPASLEYISSGFGFRTDPFTGGGAFHPGLDFRGPIGAPIYAAAAGRVSFVGQKSGYGNCVEIDHGNGLVTRYAHMSGFRTLVGREVAPGAIIGLIGSTGRSTGPHLHFEVRINGSPVNPRPFLEATADVQQKRNPAAQGRANRG
ncbi:M23 family metallopeptidase [Parablastomonas sp. CN1-191]|uniref:M23 family metallopeptidase n=1 Tax=Parablastomonas sp. CN1-191 TaxID=3400908 RepID=UPI003BF892DA